MFTRQRWIVRSTFAALAAVGAMAAVSMSSGAQPAGKASAAAPAPVPVTVSSRLPADLNPGRVGGAPNATLDQAAAFAWQEFIALNWPARMQRGRLGDRDNPGTDCLFGGVPNPAANPQPTDCATRPLTWQTFRGKAEIFPARPNSVLYDALPNYAGLYTSTIPPCPGVTPSAQPVWINLDETSEIGLAGMYAGAGPKSDPNNSAPQLIRFMAKANRQEFGYAKRINARDGVSQAMLTATSTYVQSYGSPPQGSTRYVSLPTNTIEIKAGWRQLGPNDDASHFHTTRVRYYEPRGPHGTQCYLEATWGLVALHIIRKTQTAPYFIYATFEQTENIRTASGTPTERPDGTVVARQPCRADQSAPCPTTPTTVYQDTGDPNAQPNVSLRPAGAAYCDSAAGAIGSRLYYHNIVTAGTQTQVPIGGPVCINARQHPIPPTIIAANQTAQAAIAAYNRLNGITHSPWSYYRLTNVQYRPMALTRPGTLYAGPDPATFYQSNSVVESNYSLQNFSGRLVFDRAAGGLTGAKSDFASRFGNATACPPNNPGCTTAVAALYYRRPGVRYASGYDMGGCMGCHGTAQRGGTDFSFIFGSVVRGPEPIPQQTTDGVVSRDTARIRELIHWSR